MDISRLLKVLTGLKRIYAFNLVMVFIAVSCESESRLEQEISEIPVSFEIERFERALATANLDDIPELRKKYPFLIPARETDSFYLFKQTDTLQQSLFKEVEKEFPELENLETDLTRLFQHIKYYDPTFSPPRVITATSFVDYRNSTIVTDSILIIALDTYLGQDHEFYGNIPRYITQNMHGKQIVSDVATKYGEKYAYETKRKTFLDEMVHYGKILYFKDMVIPFEDEAVRLGYTPEQLEWAKANEFQIWTHFIEKEMLYSTDSSLPNRFIAPAPFSKFYLQLDNEAPGRLGQFIGWQMVRSYMDNNDVPLLKMMEMGAEEIFKQSKYKPNR